MTSEAEKAHKRAHWRALGRLREAHPAEFQRYLTEEKDGDAAISTGPRPAPPTAAELATLHRARRAS